MREGLRLNGEKYSKLYNQKIALGSDGVAFYSGSEESDAALKRDSGKTSGSASRNKNSWSHLSFGKNWGASLFK